jgi:hypothetical protein
MARSTGPVLAMGAVTMANQSIFNGKPVDLRVPIATGLTAVVFAFGERAAPDLVVGLAWLALVAVLLTRIDPKVPSPAESALKWWQQK